MKGPLYYILDAEKRPIPAADVLEWGHFFNSPDRIVDNTEVGDLRISTVFLGLDHRFFGDGPPILFETMIFGGPLNMSQWRYASWDDAETGHKAAVRRAPRGRSLAAWRAQPAESKQDGAAESKQEQS